MPGVGIGTFGSDRFSGEDITQAVKGAIAAGYRHIDCASVYGNEHLIGKSFKEAMDAGIKREELFITSKHCFLSINIFYFIIFNVFSPSI